MVFSSVNITQEKPYEKDKMLADQGFGFAIHTYTYYNGTMPIIKRTTLEFLQEEEEKRSLLS